MDCYHILLLSSIRIRLTKLWFRLTQQSNSNFSKTFQAVGAFVCGWARHTPSFVYVRLRFGSGSPKTWCVLPLGSIVCYAKHKSEVIFALIWWPQKSALTYVYCLSRVSCSQILWRCVQSISVIMLCWDKTLTIYDE